MPRIDTAPTMMDPTVLMRFTNTGLLTMCQPMKSM